MKNKQKIQLIKLENIVMDPTYSQKPQLRIKNTNIYLDKTVTLTQ